MKTAIVYLRVSTDKQGSDGLGIAAQRARAVEIAERYGYVIGATFEEVESGRARRRPQLNAAVRAVEENPEAVLVVAKLDRLARDVQVVLSLSDRLAGRVLFCDFPDIQPGPVGRLMLTLLAAVAEFEARRISERTRDALLEIKSRLSRGARHVSKSGRHITQLGRPKGSRTKCGQSLRRPGRKMEPLKLHEMEIVRLREGGCSIVEIANRLNESGTYRRENGKPWDKKSVSAAYNRAVRAAASFQEHV